MNSFFQYPARAFVACALITAFWNSVVSAQEEPAFISVGGVRQDTVVVLTRIAVLPRDGVARNLATVAQALGNYGLTLTQGNFGRLLIAELEQPRSRGELDQLAQQLRTEESELFLSAGFVLRDPNGGSFEAVNDRLVVKFSAQATPSQIAQLHALHGTKLVHSSPALARLQLLRTTPAAKHDALEISNRYDQHPLVEYAHPNSLRLLDMRNGNSTPNDPLFAQQWHLLNTGQGGGIVDADIDADRAWTVEDGEPTVVIAVLDGGFDMSHPDLAPNMWTNTAEANGTPGVDDDGNGYVDDINGWDFDSCSLSDVITGSICGDNDPSFESDLDLGGIAHGTVDAGGAIAQYDNGLGVSGSCPACRFMPIRMGNTGWADYMAILYAHSMGAAVMSASWGCDSGCYAEAKDALHDAAINGRGGKGTLIFFAVPNNHTNVCDTNPLDYSALSSVIAISAANDSDQILTGTNGWPDPGGAFGNCVNLLGPTYGGARWGTTTDLQGSIGYNDALALGSGVCAEPQFALDYTFCATGTSFATPVVAGVGGLVLSANGGLTRLEAQRVLQDTADKVQPSIGAYSADTGFSTPASGEATHGYGRTNAFEAVRVVASTSAGGRAGVDIFVRDNDLDWGNTEQPSSVLFAAPRAFNPFWRSADIKVDAPPFAQTPSSNAEFNNFAHENPIANQTNRVYVRVRNRGPTTAQQVTVKLHWASAGTSLPPLPGDFWTQFPADSADQSDWKSLGTLTLNDLAYSGASVAGSNADSAQIGSFDFPAPNLSAGQSGHHCLLAVITSPQDDVSSTTKTRFQLGQVTPNDNNVTHRNVVIVGGTAGSTSSYSFFVRNPLPHAITTILTHKSPGSWKLTPKGFSFDQPFSLEPGGAQRVAVEIRPAVAGEAHLMQLSVPGNDESPTVLGGLTFEFQ